MTIGLPISRISNVTVNLSVIPAQAPAINTCLELGTSTVIDTVQRIREYGSLAEVALDFSTISPEYLGAVRWFGQSPSPDNLLIGRWVKTASVGQLIGGGVLAANQLSSAWTSITNGGFLVFIDGIPYAISALNFSAISNLNAVAAVIQAGVRTATSGTQTFLYYSNYNNFILSDTVTGVTSIVGFIQPSAAVGFATFAGQPAPNDTITIDGTLITFVSGTPSGSQVQISGVNLAGTLVNLLAFLTASVDVNIVLMNYYVVGSTLYIVSKLGGVAGNSYTLTKSASNITLSGAVLAGGVASDISAMTSATSTSSGAYQAPGLAAETAVTAVTLFDSLFGSDWYALVVPAAVDADHEAIAAYIEADNHPPHYYGITTAEAGVLVTGDTSDIAYVLSLLKYNKTAVQFCSTDSYAIFSYLARILTTVWAGNNTTITLKFKLEPGIVPELLNTTQANAAEAKNCNVYTTYNGGIAFIEEGVSVSGQFTDTVIGADWLAGQIAYARFNTLYTSPTKVPQTDAGAALLNTATAAACRQGIVNGLGAPGVWNSAGFGNLNPGDTLLSGFYIYSVPMATQSEADRAARIAPVAQIAFKLGGAIHKADAVLNINA